MGTRARLFWGVRTRKSVENGTFFANRSVPENLSLISQVLVLDVVSELWELAGYLDCIQYYPAVLEVPMDAIEGYCS